MTAVVSGNTIRITGTPTTGQTYAAGSIMLHDAAGASVTKTFSITINPSVQITTASFLPTTLAALYTATLKDKGGTGVVTFALTAGSLPPGMNLSGAGIITGVARHRLLHVHHHSHRRTRRHLQTKIYAVGVPIMGEA